MKAPKINASVRSLACLAALCLGAHAQSLLVANQGNATVSIVDPAQGKQISAVAENTPGVHGHEIIASADGKTAFLPIYGSTGVGKPGIDGHQLLVIDIPSQKIIGDIDFGHGVRPHQPVLDPVHHLLYITTELDRSITVIDPRTLKIVGRVPTGQDESHMLALSHDGTRGYTANVGPGTVSVLDMIGRKTITIIPVAPSIQRISISNNDKHVFTSDVTSPRLALIDTATNKVVTWVQLPGPGYGTAPTPDGHSLLVAVPSTNEVAVVDLATMKVTHHIPVPPTPQEILIRPDGKAAYVSCISTGKVAELNLSNWTVSRIITAGPGADGLAWAK
jgi:DNA-binding beta-propeller fold protein YncE